MKKWIVVICALLFWAMDGFAQARYSELFYENVLSIDSVPERIVEHSRESVLQLENARFFHDSKSKSRQFSFTLEHLTDRLRVRQANELFPELDDLLKGNQIDLPMNGADVSKFSYIANIVQHEQPSQKMLKLREMPVSTSSSVEEFLREGTNMTEVAIKRSYYYDSISFSVQQHVPVVIERKTLSCVKITMYSTRMHLDNDGKREFAWPTKPVVDVCYSDEIQSIVNFNIFEESGGKLLRTAMLRDYYVFVE